MVQLVSLTIPRMNPQTQALVTATLPGALIGDIPIMAPLADPGITCLSYEPRISADNTLQVLFSNASAVTSATNVSNWNVGYFPQAQFPWIPYLK